MYTLKEVKTKKEIKDFTNFPNKLYKNNPYFVPALSIDEIQVFNPSINPALKYCEAIRYLAYDQSGKIVGRIGGIINHQLNKAKGESTVRFTRFDAIDDVEVTKRLVNKIIEWGKTYNMNKIIGPMGFSDLDRMGMLVEGFDEFNLAITIYNAPYYQTHFESLGFVKEVDWLEYQIPWPKKVPEKVERVSNIVKTRYGYRLVKLSHKKEIDKYAYKAFDTYNEAFMELYGFHPLNKQMMDYYINQVKLIVRLEYLWFVVDKEEKMVAFGIIMPSLSKALKKSNGKLFPFGLFRILKALKKNNIVDFYFIAIDPKHQGKGALALIMEDAAKVGIKNKIIMAETGPELENNIKIHQQWSNYEPRNHRRRRSYTKAI
ncbi:MAG: hypothetical protein WC939_00580 [Acholeplasmataceae bacterium]